jgi:predicted MFS family arabinose efflux permease
LYAFWAFLPIYLLMYNRDSSTEISVSLWTFVTIAIGAIGCVLGGYYSLRIGSEKVASRALFTSLLCILASPFVLSLPIFLFIPFILLWGLSVIIDSPQFSSSSATNAPSELTGTALTIMNSIGFAITIGSISVLSSVTIDQYMFWWLLPGPLIGLGLFWWHFHEPYGHSNDL